jgi:hypothetical protein
MRLPSSFGGGTTERVGYLEAPVSSVAQWLWRGLGEGWEPSARVGMLDVEVLGLLSSGREVSRYACVPVGGWTAILTDGPLGTDVGVLPSLAARQLGCVAARAVCVDDSALFPARVLEVYGPTGLPPLALVRSIVAANDGGRWVFETSGDPLPFEDLASYEHRRKTSRLTCDMVIDYLRALGVPVDQEPDWAAALFVERA